MIIKAWVALLGMPAKSTGKTGGRELAVTLGMVTIFFLFWWGNDLTPDHKRDIVFYLIVLSGLMLMYTFGMKALVNGWLDTLTPGKRRRDNSDGA